jgi:hypothetical protein
VKDFCGWNSDDVVAFGFDDISKRVDALGSGPETQPNVHSLRDWAFENVTALE